MINVDQFNIDDLYRKIMGIGKLMYEKKQYKNFSNAQIFYNQIRELQYATWIGPDLPPVPFSAYNATFDKMEGLQFAYYLFWRTNALKGNVINANCSYFYVFIYELLAGFHGSNSNEIYNLLLNTYEKYRVYYPKADFYLPVWILQFSLLNGILEDKKFELEKVFYNLKEDVEEEERILDGNYHGCFDFIMSASSYKMSKKSKFYLNNEKGRKLLDAVFDSCMININEFMASKNLVLSEFLIGKRGKVQWDLYMSTPWSRHLDVLNISIPCEQFEFNGKYYEYRLDEEQYYTDGIEVAGKITGGQDNPYTNYLFHNSEFIAYLVKCIEQVCRQKVQHKSSLRPSYIHVYGTRRLNDLVESGEIPVIVNKTIEDYIVQTHYNLK